MAIELVGDIPTSAIRIHGNLVGGQPRIPGIQPFSFELFDLRGDICRHALAPACKLLRRLVQQGAQEEFNIGKDHQIGGVVFVQLRWIDIDLDEFDVCRLGQPTRSRVLAETATKSQHQIGLFGKLA